jgi:hypothetical protein
MLQRSPEPTGENSHPETDFSTPLRIAGSIGCCACQPSNVRVRSLKAGPSITTKYPNQPKCASASSCEMAGQRFKPSYSAFAVQGQPSLTMMVFTPVTPDDAARVRTLVQGISATHCAVATGMKAAILTAVITRTYSLFFHKRHLSPQIRQATHPGQLP